MKMGKKVCVIIPILLLTLIYTGCIDTENYTYIGTIIDFTTEDCNTAFSRLTSLEMHLDTNETIYTVLRYMDATKVRKGQQVYEDEKGLPWILIDGKYY